MHPRRYDVMIIHAGTSDITQDTCQEKCQENCGINSGVFRKYAGIIVWNN